MIPKEREDSVNIFVRGWKNEISRFGMLGFNYGHVTDIKMLKYLNITE